MTADHFVNALQSYAVERLQEDERKRYRSMSSGR